MATEMKYHQYVEDGKLFMACKKNCGNYEVVGKTTISTTCWSCIMKTLNIKKKKEIKNG